MRPEIGMVLYGYCNGYFGDDANDKRIEAFGADWIVCRPVCDCDAPPLFAEFGNIVERDKNVAEWLVNPEDGE